MKMKDMEIVLNNTRILANDAINSSNINARKLMEIEAKCNHLKVEYEHLKMEHDRLKVSHERLRRRIERKDAE